MGWLDRGPANNGGLHMALSKVGGKRAGAGRPKGTTKLKPDEETFKTLRGLGDIQCTVIEAAAVFRVSKVTMETFLNLPGAREAFHEGQAEGRTSLRRTQFRLAQKNAAMAIFLGKNYLGQADKLETAHSGNMTFKPDLSLLTDAEKETLAKIKLPGE